MITPKAETGLLFLHIRRSIGRPKQVKTSAQHVVRFVLGLFLLTLGNGCVTKHLWENETLKAWNQPATNPNLRLFTAKQTDDLLVVYNEYSERSDKTHTRAYWLKENQKLLAQGRSPHFVSPIPASGISAIPVFFAGTNQINQAPPYALVATNGQSFTLYSVNGNAEPYDLPVYNDQKDKVEKFALTPLATAADITIVGGFLGYLYLQGLAGSGYNHSY